MKLNDDNVKSFDCVKYFKESNDRINFLSYSSDGEKLISTSADDSINIYDAFNGKHLQTVLSKKYGAEIARFTHCNSAILHSSSKNDDAIRYLSLHDNKYLRFFKGHTKRVLSLMMSPKNDCFLSGSLDKTVRLWDLRTQDCQAVMNLTSKGLATIDPEGLIFCAYVSNESCKLYDLRTYEQGPFITFTLPQMYDAGQKSEIVSMRFSPDGKMILLVTNGSQIAIVDSYKGRVMHQFQVPGGSSSNNSDLSACFTGDSRYLMATSPESSLGNVAVWKIAAGASNACNNGMRLAMLEPPLDQDVGVIEANPLYSQLVMGHGAGSVSVWMPTMESDSVTGGLSDQLQLTSELVNINTGATPMNIDP